MIFTSSQNLRFFGPESFHDPNISAEESVGRILEAALEQKRYQVVPDDWYEIGYSFALKTDTAQFSVAVVQMAEPENWMLQLICTSEPGCCASFWGGTLWTALANSMKSPLQSTRR